MSKHVPFALGVDPTARDAGEGGGSDLVLQAVHVPSLHKSSIASLARHQANAVEFATKVCFSLFHGSEVIARPMSCTKGKLCNV